LRKADVVIVGGGIMGCSSALQLARRGMKVVLVEKGIIGNGPSGKSSAIVRQHYSNRLTARMARFGLQTFQNFTEQVGGECGYHAPGFVLLVDSKDRKGLEANLALQREVGIRAEILDAEPARELMPELSVSDRIVAAYEPEGGYVDPYLTVTAYATGARQAGVEILQESQVLGIRMAKEKIIGVDTATGRIDAPKVLNCAGAWGAQVSALAEVDAPINPCRVQIGFFRRPEPASQTHPVIGDFPNTVYYRPETGGLTLTGLIDEDEASAIVDPDRFSEATDMAFIHDIGERLVRSFPIMEQAESIGGYASLYAITPDWHPIIDEVPNGSGFFICSGFSGHGFKLGPAVGVMMADLLTGETEPLFDPTLFRYSRFADDDPVRGQYEYSITG
jgi:sarcosine oxidase subunit beta